MGNPGIVVSRLAPDWRPFFPSKRALGYLRGDAAQASPGGLGERWRAGERAVELGEGQLGYTLPLLQRQDYLSGGSEALRKPGGSPSQRKFTRLGRRGQDVGWHSGQRQRGALLRTSSQTGSVQTLHVNLPTPKNRRGARAPHGWVGVKCEWNHFSIYRTRRRPPGWILQCEEAKRWAGFREGRTRGRR